MVIPMVGNMPITGQEFVRGLVAALLEHEAPTDGWQLYSNQAKLAAEAAYWKLRKAGYLMDFAPPSTDTGWQLWYQGSLGSFAHFDMQTQEFSLHDGDDCRLEYLLTRRTLPGLAKHWRAAAQVFAETYATYRSVPRQHALYL